MRSIWIIAKMSILENSRKQVFHVLCLMMLTVIAASALLSIFTQGVQMKILKDLCMTCVLIGGAAIAIALGAVGIPGDIESRTLYPVFARPMGRAQYIVGKYLGTLITVGIGVLVMSAVFALLIFSYQGSVDAFLLTAIGFTLLEVAIIAAVATAISTFATPAVTAVLTFMIYFCGTIKIGYFGGLVDRATSGIVQSAYKLVFHLLPNLECFNLKTALVHQDAVPISYLVQVALYAVVYASFALFVGTLMFSRREV